MAIDAKSCADILREVPSLFRVPGGAVAVVKDGEHLASHTWGYADLEHGKPVTPDTQFPICSITKQMLCGLLTDLEINPPSELAERHEDFRKQIMDQITQMLPPSLTKEPGLTIETLCNNQSGIRDYWALTVLWGARPDGHFSIADHGPKMLARLGSVHFEPGTQYSYANTNFYILARAIENVTGQPLAKLLEERIFKPASMTVTRLCAHTLDHECVGYEGDEANGFFRATNCIEWAGDAGVVSTLNDMIAYEKFIDQSRSDSKTWYARNSTRQFFKDGNPAGYGNGLAFTRTNDVWSERHGGALRGFRLFRMYAPEPRLSIVVLLNHEQGDSGGLMDHVMRRVLNSSVPQAASVDPPRSCFGTYLDLDSSLAVIVSQAGPGRISVQYHRKAEKLRVVSPTRAESDDMIATFEDRILIKAPHDNREFEAVRCSQESRPWDTTSITLRCDEIDSVFHCTSEGDMGYGSFEGFLGKGPVHLMRRLAGDVWVLGCPRAMDATPPGDWTIVFERGDNGSVKGATIGCWLARKLKYVRV